LECQKGDAARTKELLKAVSLRVQNLERGMARVDSTLVTSFKGVRFELNDVWKEVGVLKLAMPVGVKMGSGTTPRFVGRQSQAPPPSLTGLSPALFQALMRQVVDEL
jgi:hypothetical protein